MLAGPEATVFLRPQLLHMLFHPFRVELHTVVEQRGRITAAITAGECDASGGGAIQLRPLGPGGVPRRAL